MILGVHIIMLTPNMWPNEGLTHVLFKKNFFLCYGFAYPTTTSLPATFSATFDSETDLKFIISNSSLIHHIR